MLDLSFLTEEEYEKLMTVLQRDADLKKKDGDRIRWEAFSSAHICPPFLQGTSSLGASKWMFFFAFISKSKRLALGLGQRSD